MRQYRLITDSPTIGPRNMAIDEAIMNAVIAGESLPTLRFYAWEPACLSLGYGQRSREADLQRLQARGWSIVRRATGGRAILHVDEMTYSLSLPDSHALAAGDIVQSYRRISQAWMQGLNLLGLATRAEKKTEKDRRPRGPVCFEVPSHYEITTGDGRKLVGSAQLRRRGGVLQHGTLPLHGDVTRICDALVFEDEADRDAAKLTVRGRAATLQDALGVIVPYEDAVDGMIDGFRQTFDAVLIPGGLTLAERQEADRLEEQFYANREWTLRR